MSVINFRRVSLKTGFEKSSDFADISASPPPTPDIIQTNLIRNYNAQIPASYPGTGTTWTDLMGSGYNATLYNGPTYTAGTPNYIETDGSNDTIYANDAGLPIGGAARTIGCWIYSSATGATKDMIGYGTNPGFNDWIGGAYVGDTNYPPNPGFAFNLYGPWIPTSLAGALLTLNAWNLCQFTWDTSYNYQLMVNDGTGANQYRSGNLGNIVDTVLGGRFYLASLPAGFGPLAARWGQYFAYNTNLTQAQLQTNFNNTKALYGL